MPLFSGHLFYRTVTVHSKRECALIGIRTVKFEDFATIFVHLLNTPLHSAFVHSNFMPHFIFPNNSTWSGKKKPDDEFVLAS